MTDTDPAPYPRTREGVTANILAAHMATQAQRSNARILTASDLDRTGMARFVYEWGVTFLLRELQERAGTKVADDVACELWEAWQDGSSLGEFLWEWLTEYGIDPEAVTR